MSTTRRESCILIRNHNPKRGQVWYLDFIMSFFIFSVVVIIFLNFIVNKSQDDKITQDQLLVEARIISNSFMLPGYPKNWSADDVERIGLTDGNSKFNRTKLLELKDVPYSTAKQTLDISHDFLVYFEDEKGDPVPVMGICSYGKDELSLEKERKIAYYHGEGNTIMAPILQEYASITSTYCPTSCPGMGIADLESFLAGGDPPDLLIIENGSISGASSIEDWVSLERNVLIIQEFAKDDYLFDWNTTGDPYGKDMNMTITKELPFLDYPVGTVLSMAGDYYIPRIDDDPNINENDYNIINYSFTLDDHSAITAWNWSNGTVYHFANINISEPAEFSAELIEAIPELMNTDCKPLDLNLVRFQDVVRLSRFLVKKDRIINMVILVWV
ncbi:MAG: hypothetical protein ABIH34_05890 [Nanoarchaeota archaeon]